jgi:hypothetical protein
VAQANSGPGLALDLSGCALPGEAVRCIGNAAPSSRQEPTGWRESSSAYFASVPEFGPAIDNLAPSFSTSPDAGGEVLDPMPSLLTAALLLAGHWGTPQNAIQRHKRRIMASCPREKYA